MSVVDILMIQFGMIPMKTKEDGQPVNLFGYMGSEGGVSVVWGAFCT